MKFQVGDSTCICQRDMNDGRIRLTWGKPSPGWPMLLPDRGYHHERRGSRIPSCLAVEASGKPWPETSINHYQGWFWWGLLMMGFPSYGWGPTNGQRKALDGRGPGILWNPVESEVDRPAKAGRPNMICEYIYIHVCTYILYDYIYIYMCMCR